jgi:hypothetical protein
LDYRGTPFETAYRLRKLADDLKLVYAADVPSFETLWKMKIVRKAREHDNILEQFNAEAALAVLDRNKVQRGI